ncbi:MAG: polysaccharide biosynthesis/export family protein [Terracidiphilus sp.]
MKSRLTVRRGTSFLLGIASLALTVAALGQSPQVTQSSVTAPPGAGASAAPSLNKSAMGQGNAPVVLPMDFAQLKIEPGDLLSVNVYDTPEMTDAYRVDSQGNLKLPLCGKVKVAGLTSDEVARLLEDTFKNAQVLNQPQVNVDVQQYAGDYVTVLGEVSSPGRVTVIAPTKLSDILAQVGGLTAIAGTRIKIRHAGDGSNPEEDIPYSRSESNQQTGAVLVRPGDTVIVPRTGIVYVLGAVYRPGGYVMQEDGKLNVAQALALSGGTLITAKTNGLRVIRRNPDGTVSDFALSYDGIVSGTQTPLTLQALDIVYVPMSKIKSVFTDATSLIGTAISSTIYTVH